MVLFVISAGPAAAEAPAWIAGRQISPSITYQYRIEQRPGFHQQFHKVTIDLYAKDVTVKLVPAEEFPRGVEYPSEFLKRTKSRVVVPACLFQSGSGARLSPLGGLRFPGGIYKRGHEFPELRIRPLNQIVFSPESDKTVQPPVLIMEDNSVIPVSGVNVPPTEPGLFLFTNPFAPVTREELKKWKASRCCLLEPVKGNREPGLYWISKVLEDPRTIHLKEENRLLVEVRGKSAGYDRLLQYRKRLHLRFLDENPFKLYEGIFCGGPLFLKNGEFFGGAVERFCSLPGSPSPAHFSSRKARLALAMKKDRRYLFIYAVDQSGFSREGMTLREFADYLSGEGVREAMALPDDNLGSVILPGGRVNATPSRMEAPVPAALCIGERPPETGETVNLLRRYRTAVSSSGMGANNPDTAVLDGSYLPVPTLNNYWEDPGSDPEGKKYLLIDLLDTYEVNALDFYHAEEAGFSSHFNTRRMTLLSHGGNKNAVEKLMGIKNPAGLSCQRVLLPQGTRMRYLKIELDEPTAFGEEGIARLSELAVWGKAR